MRDDSSYAVVYDGCMEKHQLSVNTVYVDGDVLHTVCGGETTLQMCKDFFVLVERVVAEKGRVFLLTDASKTLAISSEARRYLAERSKTYNITAVANVVTSPLTRAALTLAARAINLVGKPATQTMFCATEAEARAWIDTQREDYFRKNPAAQR